MVAAAERSLEAAAAAAAATAAAAAEERERIAEEGEEHPHAVFAASDDEEEHPYAVFAASDEEEEHPHAVFAAPEDDEEALEAWLPVDEALEVALASGDQGRVKQLKLIIARARRRQAKQAASMCDGDVMSQLSTWGRPYAKPARAILNELLQKRGLTPTYRVTRDAASPKHKPRFMAAVLVGGEAVTGDWSPGEKSAKESAAAAALRLEAAMRDGAHEDEEHPRSLRRHNTGERRCRRHRRGHATRRCHASPTSWRWARGGRRRGGRGGARGRGAWPGRPDQRF